jgi:S-layer protein (TIGR01567 family)
MRRSVLTMIMGLLLTTAYSACATEIQGEATDLGVGTFTWDCNNFKGFYYDFDTKICTEMLTFVLSNISDERSTAILLGDAPYGIRYQTHTASRSFEFKPWGTYNVIGFMTEKYFAGYNPGTLFYSVSTDNNSLSSDQLEKILIDEGTEKIVTSKRPMTMQEGYKLAIKSFDIDGNKVYLELTKDGQVVDSKVISLSKNSATIADKTYYYKNPAVGDQKNLVTIGVSFKNAFRSANGILATIDGVWQISDTPTEIKVGAQYDKMTIMTVDAINGVITMNNKDKAVTLQRNKNIAILDGINIRTAKMLISKKNPLRYRIYVNK